MSPSNIRLLFRRGSTIVLLTSSILAAPTNYKVRSDPLDAGRMRNPFISWAGPLSPHQQERYRASLHAQNTFVGDSPWAMLVTEVHHPPEQDYPYRGEEDLTVYAFRFDADGNPTDKRPLPRELRSVGFKGDARYFSAQQNDQWWVLPEQAFYPEFNPDSDYGNFEGFHVLNIGTNNMIYSKIASDATPKGLRGVCLIGDHLIYSFINNPDAKVEKSSRDIEVKGNPAFGVNAINLKTGESMLISSVGRNVVESPLSAENLRVIYHILPLDEESFTVSENSRISTHAYNLATGTWRKMTDAEMKRAATLKKARENAYDSLLIDGTYWKLWPYLDNGCLRLRAHGNTLQIPLSFGNNGVKPSKIPMAEYSRLALENPEELKLKATLTPDGIALSDKMGSYFWIPLQTFQSAVLQAHERFLGQMNSTNK